MEKLKEGGVGGRVGVLLMKVEVVEVLGEGIVDGVIVVLVFDVRV